MQSGLTRAHANRQIRQDALREYVKNQRHEQEAVELIGKIKNLDLELNANEVNRLRIALGGHLELLKKYLPDVKAVEMTIDQSGANTREDHAEAIGELICLPTGRAKVAS